MNLDNNRRKSFIFYYKNKNNTIYKILTLIKF